VVVKKEILFAITVQFHSQQNQQYNNLISKK